MRFLAVISGCGILLAGLFGLTSQGAQVALPRKASIEGTVTQSGNNEPLNGIRVSLRRADAVRSEETTAAVVTDSRGRFVFNGVDFGQYLIRAEADEFLPQEFAQSVREPTTRSISGGNVESLTINFQLVRTGVIHGRVLNESGEPIVGAVIGLLHYQYDNGKRSLVPLIRAPEIPVRTAGPVPSQVGSTAVTNDRGEYRLFLIPPDEYYLAVTPSKAGVVSVVPGVIAKAPLPTTYYPKALTIETAMPLTLSSGADLGGIDVTWRSNSAVILRGRILSPVTGLIRMPGYLTKPDGSFLDRTTMQISEDGFEIKDVPPGNYNLTMVAREPVRQEREYIGTSPVSVGISDVDDIIVNLHPPVSVRGKVTVLSGSIPDPKSPTPLQVKYNSTGTLIPNTKNGASGYAVVMADGTFNMRTFMARDWRLSISDGYLVQATYGSIDVLATGVFNPTQEAEGAVLNLTVAFDAGSLEGRVVDAQGKPRRSESVTLVPNAPRRNQLGLYFSVPTDDNGKFRFPKVPTGDYRVFSWQNLPPKAYQNSDFLQRYENQGRPIHISTQSNENVDVQIIVVQ